MCESNFCEVMAQTKMTIKQRVVKKVFEVCPTSYPYHIPVKAKQGSIGYDLVCPVDFHVAARSRVIIPLHFSINLPNGVEAKIEPRSGMSAYGMEGYGTRKKWSWKWGFIPRRKIISGKLRFDADVLPGKIDPNYTDCLNVILKNNDQEFTIKAGTRIAQITFYHTIAPFFNVVEKLSCKSRGGGLGSSGSTVKPEDTRKEISAKMTPSRLLDDFNRFKKERHLVGDYSLTFDKWLEWRTKLHIGVNMSFNEWYAALSPERKAEVDASFTNLLLIKPQTGESSTKQ